MKYKYKKTKFDNLPEAISRLEELAYNLWWSWHADARSLFKLIDRTLWKQTAHNPIRFLKEVAQEKLDTAAVDSLYLRLYNRVFAAFDGYMQGEDTWFSRTHPDKSTQTLAYLCAEFAVHTSVPIYSGGLGLLAGDTCKEASDLGLPLVAVGAFYPEGYFRQQIAMDGSQDATYSRIDPAMSPLMPVMNSDDSRLLVEIPLDGRSIYAGIWLFQVGRVPIYLLDTDIPDNQPWDRDVVARLYGGDNQIRLRQEIILGIGGMRALYALGFEPNIVHLNEGHAAFASLEMIRRYYEKDRDFEKALNSTREKLVFTTHTPVKAGHDEFPFHMMEEHFRGYWEGLDISRERFLSLGAPQGGHSFSMTLLALKTSRKANGVSAKHGEVSREMWSFLFPEKKVEEVPIGSITNGVHVPTWLSREMVELFDRYLGVGWQENHDDVETWDKILDIPDEELWNTHVNLKTLLFRYMRERARQRWVSGGVSSGQIVAFGGLLNPDALTIGFARRFATYKRADLILSDMDRLKKILHNPWQPVQLIFAGKAHPADEPGKYVLSRIIEVCASPEFGGHIAFIENFDKSVAHQLVHGVDIWLNNPIPPKEASGTSGQKASLNGVVNLSVLDGWWCEGFNQKNGWGIQEVNGDQTALEIYRILEEEVVPRFYERDSRGIPREWCQLMKEAIRSTAAPFSARRMVKEYCGRIYCPEE
jgi:starch phosphorylase